MGLFKSKSIEEEQLAALCNSLGEAAGKVATGAMPPDYFGSTCSFRREEIQALLLAVSRSRGEDFASKLAVNSADIYASAFGKNGGKRSQASARELARTGIEAMLSVYEL